ncbi:MAG: nucleoside hydrolase [Candidatus Latescibacteria bacterium]|nr:nucleoside hydrolase [Candidatus Latescibacterota bacterium]
MQFPPLSDSRRLELLQPPKGPVRMVLDTDTYNEIDDQFAVVHTLLSPERLRLEAIYAAPFHNNRSQDPGDGMQKSYEEILRLLERLDTDPEDLVHKGSTAYLSGPEAPQESGAAADLVMRAMDGEGPLYVAAIGAITNVASALLLEPRIAERIVVVWLGGHSLHWPTAREFNLQQDLHASRLLFDCGVPLVQLPCHSVASHLLTTVAEMDHHVGGRGAIGDYLVEIFKDYGPEKAAWSKELWDLAATGYLVDPSWVPTRLVHSPILTDQFTYSADPARHFIRSAVRIQRDGIFGDLFAKLAATAAA